MTRSDVPKAEDELAEADTAMGTRDDEARRLRLRKTRIGAKYKSAREAAHLLGLKESTYRAHENGGRELTEQAAMRYAEKFGISYDWLWSGIEPETNLRSRNVQKDTERPLPNGLTPIIPKAQDSSFLPIRGRAQGGDGGAVVLDGSVMDYLAGPSNLDHSSGAYGIEVIGDSMMRRYRPGEIVWVNPNRAVHKGDCAVLHVRQPNGELHAFIKEYVSRTDERVTVMQYNPEIEIVFDREEVEAIHLIVGTGNR